MTTYAYYRVSTDLQDYKNQRLGVCKYCMDNNIIIDKEITDKGVSGAKDPKDRKLGRLLRKLKEGDSLICSEISRLGRKMFMVMEILGYCMKKGVKIFTVKDGFKLDDSIQSQVIAFAFSLSAQIERQLIQARTKEALARLRQEGKHLGRPFSTNYLKLSVESVREYITQGLTKADIARKFECPWVIVHRFMKRNGL